MTEIFLKVFNMSVSASWLILAVLVLRLVLRKSPKWVVVLLWGVVALRLLCPFSIESALSLIPSAETVPQEIIFAARPAIQSGVASVDAAVNPILTESFAPTTEVASINPIQVFLAIWANLWLLGAAAMALYALASFWRLRRKVATAVRIEENVFESEAVTSPFILGLFRPRIYLPFSMDARQRAHVLAHERAHLARRDHLWKPLGYALLCIHWFNPLLWLAYVLLCRDIELACDEKVVRTLECGERADYGEALLACAVSRRSIAACPLAFGEVGVKARVKSVLHYKKPAFWLVALSLTACAALAVCFLTDPKEAAEAHDTVVAADADLDHDGENETVSVRTLAKDEYYELSVIKADGTLLYRTEAHTSHSGWSTLLLYEDDGVDYLVSYSPAMWQGVGTYEWTQFYLEKGEGDAAGRLVEVGSKRVEFVLPLTMTSELSGFAERTNWILKNSTVLLTTEGGKVVIGPVAATDVPQIYPVVYDPDGTSAAMTGISEPFANGELLHFLFASGAGAWGTTLTLYPDGSFEGVYEDGEMGSNAPEYPAGTCYLCEFTGRFGAMEKVDEGVWSMQLEELTHDPAGRAWIEDGQRCISAEAYGIEGGTEFRLYAPEASINALSEEFLQWSFDSTLYRDGTLKTLGCWALHNVGSEYGFFEYEPYAAPAEEDAEAQAEHDGKVYFSDLLGYNGYVAVTERIGELWTQRTYYAVEDGSARPIAESFGFEEEDYSLDLDGDGVTELICNVTFGADGAQRVYVYRRRGDEIWLGQLSPNGKEDFDNWGVGAYWTEYDAQNKLFRLHYWPKTGGDYITEEISSLEAFEFTLYVPSEN